MRRCLFALYRFGTGLYFLGVRLAATLGHRSARARRRGLAEKPVVFQAPQPGQCLVWFHCASAGELEQAVPVMESLKHHRPDWAILCSVFSPSGYDFALTKKYACIDVLCFLPDDVPRAAHRWLLRWQPRVAVFVKYELWWGYLRTLKRHGIPSVLMAAHYSYKHRWQKPYLRCVLAEFTKVLTQNEASADFAKSLGANAAVAGDPRFDRVESLKNKALSAFMPDKNRLPAPVVVLGSVWPRDMRLWWPVCLKYRQRYVWWICPHNPQSFNTENIKWGENTQVNIWHKTADLLEKPLPGINIITELGVLSGLYAWATWAYVGGGFGKGVHNLLEPAVWGIPVLSGPHIRRFAEAQELREAGILWIVRSPKDIESFFQSLNDSFMQRLKEKAFHYFSEKKGLAEKIVREIISLMPHG
ncbi:MAG: hypothetical protein NZM65_09590 [Flavobacteriales bacterium]|nr:hypothetical protein [Flavobacteriales bacterium]MDW8410922.1 glycosyltransferase N-terminal domain-containing protein [Flavobacteriales bacterium]